MTEGTVVDTRYVIWVCPDPDCSYYETQCGMSEERFCPVFKIGSRTVHPYGTNPRLKPVEVTPEL